MLDFLLCETHQFGLRVLHAEVGDFLEPLGVLELEALQVVLDFGGAFLFDREVALAAFEVARPFIEIFFAVRQTPLNALHLLATFAKLVFAFLYSGLTPRYCALGFLTSLLDESTLFLSSVFDHFRGVVLRCLHAVAGDVTPDEKETQCA